MMKRFLLALSLLCAPALAAAVPAVVTPDWVAANLERSDLVVLDLQPERYYQRAHVPGAVNTAYKAWRTESKDGTPGMLPPAGRLSALIGGLGIDADSHVVVVPLGRGAGDLAMATRVHWSLKAAGVERVSVLDGGLVAYAEGRKRPLESGRNRPQKSEFQARLRDDLVATRAQVRRAIEGDGPGLVDNRSRAEYLGLWRGGPDERPGTLPGAANLPFDWLTADGSAAFLEEDALRRVFAYAGVDPEAAGIYFCHTGHRASLAWFVAHELLGSEDARLYDGSTVQWASTDDLPVEREVELD